jgi:hypothetical protein
MMVDSAPQQPQTPAIDTGLLTQIQALTSVLMSRSGQTICPSPITADDKVCYPYLAKHPAFKRVSFVCK